MKQRGVRAHEHPFYVDMVPGSVAFVAHRGGDGGHENTMEAFEASQQAGVTMIETDIITTRDDVPVHFHGSWRNRRIVGGTDYDDLNTPGVHRRLGFAGAHIPALEESLSAFPDMRFFLDIKSGRAPKAVARTIQQAGAVDRVSIDGEYWNRTLSILEEIPKGLSTTIGPIGLVALHLGACNLPGYRLLRDRYVAQATSLSLPLNRVRLPMMQLAHEMGIPVFLYRVHDETDVNMAASYDARGIMTSKLALLGHTAATKSVPANLVRAA